VQRKLGGAGLALACRRVRVLIVDGGQERSSIAAARALAACGWTVGSASPLPSLAARSRSVAAWHHIAHTDEGEEAFLESLDEVAARGGYETAFVSWDVAVAAVSANRERLRFALGYGPHEGVAHAMDKERLTRSAERAGLGVPLTVRASAEGLSRIEGPVVIKPASPLEPQFPTLAYASAREALGALPEIERLGARAIAQEQLRGSLCALTLVAGEQGIVSICQQRAIHIWPSPVGVTARGETVPVDGELRAGVEALLDELRWRGIAQLQFLVGADGVARLLDFNPRLYGSIALAIAAGANHPDACARVATGRDVSSAVGRPGVRFQWFSRDLRASMSGGVNAREGIELTWTALTAAHSVWSWREPWLTPAFLAQQSGRALRRRRLQRASAGAHEELRNARLHGLSATPRVRRALRTRPVPAPPRRLAERLAMKAGALSYERAWLEPLQRAREEDRAEARGNAVADDAAGHTGPRFLVRVDEFPYSSGFDDARFGLEASERFHDVMAQERVPHLMAVVPQWTHEPLNPAAGGGRPLDDRDRELIERMRSDGVTFAQHGTTHRTRTASPRERSELSGLSAGALAELLEHGREKLAELDVHPRVLVPPFNRFEASQWPVLAERYDVITGGPESVPLMGFHGGPLWRGEAIYLPCYAPLYASASTVLGAVERILDAGVEGWVPVVLHTSWEVPDAFAALRRLARRISPYAASWKELLASADASRSG